MRHIVLYEFQPGLVTDIIPPSSYLEGTNGTLALENCRLTIDENGFMISERPCGEEDKKILLLGGSAVENLYIPQNSRILKRLEDIFCGMGKSVKVYNAGISDVHLLHIVNILLNKGVGIRPRCVVYYSTPLVDGMVNEVDNTFWNPMDRITPVRAGPKEKKTKFISSFHNKNKFEDEKRLLRTLYDICRNFEITLLVATCPIYYQYDEYMQRIKPNRKDFEDVEARTINLNAVLRDICLEKKGVLLDLEKAFADLDHHQYFYDHAHPNVKGCELIATITGHALQPYI